MVRPIDLYWDDRNEEHVARQAIDPEEVEEVSRNRPYLVRVSRERYRLIGQSDSGRFITAYVAPREDGLYYVVTARDATANERRSYRRR